MNKYSSILQTMLLLSRGNALSSHTFSYPRRIVNEAGFFFFAKVKGVARRRILARLLAVRKQTSEMESPE